MGLIPPHAGTVRRGGRVGYLAQDAHIFTTSVAENVRIGNKDATDEQISDALHRAGLPLDPSRLVGEDGTTLSGGERRRLALARLLVADRDLWILDEPTEHLDQATAEALMGDVWRACEGAGGAGHQSRPGSGRSLRPGTAPGVTAVPDAARPGPGTAR